MSAKKTLEFQQQLSSIPVRNTRVTLTPSATDPAPIIEVELKYPLWLVPLRKLLGMPSRRRLQLDPVGQKVYESIDGKKSFETLVDEFAAEYKLTFFESRALLMSYMRTLMKCGLIVIGLQR